MPGEKCGGKVTYTLGGLRRDSGAAAAAANAVAEGTEPMADGCGTRRGIARVGWRNIAPRNFR